LSERRVAILFALVAVVLLASLSAQSPERVGDHSLWVEGPIKRLVAGGAGFLDRAREGRRTVARLVRENAELRGRLRELEAAHAAAVGAALEVDLLTARPEYEQPSDTDLIPADVVYVDHRSLRRTAILRIPDGYGDEDWLRRPVTTVDGLLGRVISTEGEYLRVLLVTDHGSSVGAMVERTRRQGIARGAGAGGLALMFVPEQVDVLPGDRVVTAGIDGLFPRGIPVGAVTTVESNGELFHEIRMTPTVDLGSLSHAFVWRRDPVPQAVMDGADGVGR